MARPKRYNADYHTHDANMRNDPRIKAVRNKFSHMGYAVWNYLLEILTDADHFKLEWTDLNIEIFAGDFDTSTEELELIVGYLLKLKLVQKEGDFLLCEKHISNFSGLITKRETRAGKKPPEGENPEKESFGNPEPQQSTVDMSFGLPKPQTNEVSGVQKPQSKVKESIVKESKVNYSIVNVIKNYTLSSECEDFKISNEDKEKIYTHFTNWIDNNAPRVNAMQEPFTPEQAIKLMIDYRGEFIESLLRTMHSEPPVAAKIGSDIIFRNWAERRNIKPMPQITDKNTTLWRRFTKQIKGQISPEEYAKWFESLSIVSFDAVSLRLLTVSKESAQHLANNYHQVVSPIVKIVFGESLKVSYLFKNQ